MPFPEQIKRLVFYGNRLGYLCEEVSQELKENQERRSEWFQFTRTWKNAWLTAPDRSGSGNPSLELLRRQVSVKKRLSKSMDQNTGNEERAS